MRCPSSLVAFIEHALVNAVFKIRVAILMFHKGMLAIVWQACSCLACVSDLLRVPRHEFADL